jgi:hypothetical protein
MDLPPSLKTFGLKMLELKTLGLQTLRLQTTRVRMALVAIAVVAVSFFMSLIALDWLSPRGTVPKAAQTELPPLPPASRASYVMAPVSIALSALRDAADRAAPRNFAGKADNPVSQVLQNADIGWTASRGPISATGAQDVLSLSTPLTGKLNVTGSLSSKGAGAVGDAIGQTDRQHQHQGVQCQRRDQGAGHHHLAPETRRRLAGRAESFGAGQHGR